MAGVQERCPVLQSAGLRRASQGDQVRLHDRRRCHPRLFLRSRFHGRRPIINSEEEPLCLSTSYFSKTPLSTLGVLTATLNCNASESAIRDLDRKSTRLNSS